ncbi:hypothetical protein ACM66B_000736 [Microbotryomycetes sp. NB124-2]
MPWPLQTFFARPPAAQKTTQPLTVAADAHKSDHDRLQERPSTSAATRGDDASQSRSNNNKQRNRRSLIGSTIALGVESAAFSVAVAQAAYQLWQNPEPVNIIDDDVDRHIKTRELKAAQRVANAGAVAAIEAPASPPPYSELPTNDVPTRDKDRASARDRKHIKRRSLAMYTSSSPYREPVPESDSFAHLRLPRQLAHFQPLEDHEEEQHPDDEESRKVDAEMDAMAERIKSLIETGTAALVSTPVLSPMATPPGSPKKPSTNKSTLHRRHSTHSGLRTPGTPRTSYRSTRDVTAALNLSPTKHARHKSRMSVDGAPWTRDSGVMDNQRELWSRSNNA